MKYIVKYQSDGSDEIIADKYEIVGPTVNTNADEVVFSHSVIVAKDLYRRAIFTDDKGVVAEINMQYVRGIFTCREDPEEIGNWVSHDGGATFEKEYIRGN